MNPCISGSPVAGDWETVREVALSARQEMGEALWAKKARQGGG